MLEEHWKNNLKKHGVKFNFKPDSWSYKTLLFMYKNLGLWLNKKVIAEEIGYSGSDLQNPRHLAKQAGWNIEQDRKGNYRLVCVKVPHPAFSKKKRLNELKTTDFEKIKKEYDYRCATCGEKENSIHRFEYGKVVLEKGHMNPKLDMSAENIIPQCNFCNKFYLDKYIFDKQGRVMGKC